MVYLPIINPWDYDDEKSEVDKYLDSLAPHERRYLEVGGGCGFIPTNPYEEQRAAGCRYELESLRRGYERALERDEQKKRDRERSRFLRNLGRSLDRDWD